MKQSLAFIIRLISIVFVNALIIAIGCEPNKPEVLGGWELQSTIFLHGDTISYGDTIIFHGSSQAGTFLLLNKKDPVEVEGPWSLIKDSIRWSWPLTRVFEKEYVGRFDGDKMSGYLIGSGFLSGPFSGTWTANRIIKPWNLPW